MTDRLTALLEEAPRIDAPDPEDEGEVEDPRWLGYWLLSMARETARATQDVAPPSSLVRTLETLLADRPTPDAELGQLLIDPASVARRATVVAAYAAKRPGPVVALGDDDGVSLALALLGLDDVVAIDLDARVLSFLEQSAKSQVRSITTIRADFFEDRVPDQVRHRAAVVVTDPFRSLEDAAPFVAHALATMRRDAPSFLLYADHEAWSFDHEQVRDLLVHAGLVSKGRKRRLHRYPLTRRLFPRLAETAEALGVTLEWLEALVDETSAWSDLFIWERPPR